jgi:hypothetical protein
VAIDKVEGTYNRASHMERRKRGLKAADQAASAICC